MSSGDGEFIQCRPRALFSSANPVFTSLRIMAMGVGMFKHAEIQEIAEVEKWLLPLLVFVPLRCAG